jgi:hypothetical protein
LTFIVRNGSLLAGISRSPNAARTQGITGMTVLLVLLAAVSIWGVVATAVAVSNDGYRRIPTRLH